MTSSTGADARVKAGFWFSTPEVLQVKDIDSKLFTHLYAGFAKVQYPIPPHQKIDDVIKFPDNSGRFESFPKTVRKKNIGVKALLSIGGEDQDSAAAIASVVRNAEEGLRHTFITRARYLATTCDYDGLDLCWLYPSNAHQEITTHLASFLSDWHKNVGEKMPKLLLTATVFLHPAIDDKSFDDLVKALSHNMDWINVLATDFYTPSKSRTETGPVHAWLNPTDKEGCGSAGIREWTENKKVEAGKLVLGLPFYGYEWILNNPGNHGFFVDAHPSVSTKPILYRTIQERLGTGDYETLDPYDEKYVAIYSHNDQGSWISYDNGQTISEKVRDAIDGTYKLRGYFAWTVGGDDGGWTLSRAAHDACLPVRR